MRRIAARLPKSWPFYTAIALSFILSAYLMSAIYWPAGHGMDIYDRPIGQDFINIWAGPRLAFGGHLDALFDYDAYYAAIKQLYGHKIQSYIWSYPPQALLLYAPFSLASYPVSLALWTIAGLGVWLAAYRCYAGHWQLKQMVLLLLSPACFMNIIGGQNGFFTAALFLGGVLAIRKWPSFAGILFGLLTFKPQFGFILPFALAVMRAWKVIVITVLTFAGLALATTLIFGMTAWRQFLTVTSPEQADFMLGIEGFYSYLIVSFMVGLNLASLKPAMALAIQLIVSVVAIHLVCRSLKKIPDLRQQAFLLCSAISLVSPYMLSYDLCLVTIPLSCALADNGLGVRRRVIYLLGWLAPTLGLVLALSSLRILQIVAPLSLLAVFLSLLQE